MLLPILSAIPIIAIFVGMVIFRKSAMMMAPIGWILALIIALFAFKGEVSALLYTSGLGGLDGARLVWMIFGAFVLLTVMTASGAMATIQGGFARITNDKRLLVSTVAIPFGTFLEGAAGAGAAPALGAPFLVAVGMPPIIAASAMLIGNSCPVSWGAAGVTSIMGAPAAGISFPALSAMTGMMHSLGFIFLPLLILYFTFGRKSSVGIKFPLLLCGVLSGVFLFILSNFSPVMELSSLITGLVVMGLFAYRFSPPTEVKEAIPLSKCITPYVVLAVLLVVVRLSFPMSTLIAFGGGYTVWVGCVILSSAFIASLIFRRIGHFPKDMLAAFKKVWPALITMVFLLAMVNTMKTSGMIKCLAIALANAAGKAYPAMAVLIGQIGSFITGTNLGSNLMFNPMHLEACKQLGINIVTVAAGQNTGGAIGNMICPNNVVAVAAVVGLIGKEGDIMRRTIIPSLIFFVFYSIIAMLYTYVIFPI
jgi:lactate permease